MAEKKPAPGQRLPAAERREQMLKAASIVFGERGYAGTTTDAVAKAAGVSQAYIVRTFGSKENLFAETAGRAVDKTIDVFRTAAQGVENPQELLREMGHAYVKLVADRGILLTMMHLFTMGHHERFGQIARDEFMRIYRVLHHEIGMSPKATEKFLAKGMLTVLGMRLTDVMKTDPDIQELLACTFTQEETESLAELAKLHTPLPPAARGRTSS